jgi:Uma2 family endonuclease
MALPIKKVEDKFTYKDYRQWPNHERWELIHGLAFNMSPAPSTRHQRIAKKLLLQFENFLLNKTCEVFQAPFDVRLPENNETDDEIAAVVQPDLSVICDPKKIDEKGCKGAPDLIVEILSPATAGKDMKEKLFLYEKHEVKEYWIVHPDENIIQLYKLGENGKYQFPLTYTDDDVIKTDLFPGLEIKLDIVFNVKKSIIANPPSKKQ